MKRPRGRRVALLLASALPLLAEHDVYLADDAADSNLRREETARNKRLKRSWSGRSLYSDGRDGDQCSVAADCCGSSTLTINSNANSTHANSSHCWPCWNHQPCQSDCENDFYADIVVPYRPPWQDDCYSPVEQPDSLGEGDDSVTTKGDDLSSTIMDDHDVNGSPETIMESDSMSETSNNTTTTTTAAATNATSSPASASASSSPPLSSNTFMDAVDYASKAAGALILEASPGLDGAANLLTKDKDKYAIADCQPAHDSSHPSSSESYNYFVVIGLSEDILVKRIVLANYERYSSPFREFSVYGSPTADGNWMYQLGNFEMQLQQGKQSFDLQQHVWARYLKFEFKSYYGDEHYCTLSQIMVHGSTVLQGFHEQWQDDEGTDEPKNVVAETTTTTTSDNASLAHQEHIIEGSSSRNETTASLHSESTVTATVMANKVTRIAATDQSTGQNAIVAPQNDTMLKPALPDLTSSNGSDPAMKWGALSAASICLSNCRFAQATTPATKDATLRTADDSYSSTNHPSALVSNSVSSNQREKSDWTESKLVQDIQGMMKSIGFDDSTLDNVLLNLRNMKRSMDHNVLSPASSDETLSSAKPEDKVVADVLHHPEALPSETTSSGDSDALLETNQLLAKLLDKYPSAQCLLQLDLGTFKAKFSKTRPGAIAHDPSGVAAMEPIFKKLKDEIKGMQAAIALQDQYAMESLSCYQRIIMDLLLDMESTRMDLSDRIAKLEMRPSVGHRLIFALRALFMSLMPFVTSLAAYGFHVLAKKEYGAFISFLRLTACSSVLVIALLFVSYLCGRMIALVKGRPPASEKDYHYISDDSSSDAGEQ